MRHHKSSSVWVSFFAGYATGYHSNGASPWKPCLGSEVHFEAIQTAATVAITKRSLYSFGAAADVRYYAACMYMLLKLGRTRIAVTSLQHIVRLVSSSSRLLYDRAGGALRKAILSLFSCIVRTVRSKFDLIPDSRHYGSYIPRRISVLAHSASLWPCPRYSMVSLLMDAATSAWRASCSPDHRYNRRRSSVIVTSWKT
jgi:hypothetical protein